MKNWVSSTLAICLLLLVGFMVGCKGAHGNQGDTGVQGLPGVPGGLPDGVVSTGTVTSDAFPVTIPGLDVSKDDLVWVYACNLGDTQCVQLNLYAPTVSASIGYIESPGMITLDELKSAAMPNYFITYIIRH